MELASPGSSPSTSLARLSWVARYGPGQWRIRGRRGGVVTGRLWRGGRVRVVEYCGILLMVGQYGGVPIE